MYAYIPTWNLLINSDKILILLGGVRYIDCMVSLGSIKDQILNTIVHHEVDINVFFH